MHDLGSPHLRDQVLGHRLAGAAELVDAAVDGRHPQFQPQPAQQKFLHLQPREAETQRQRGNEDRQRRADQAALAQLQVALAPLDPRVQPHARAGHRRMTAHAAGGEVAVPGGNDLEAHRASLEVKDVVRADLPASPFSAERRLAGFAHHRHVLDFPAHHDRLAPPVPRHAQPLAWRLRQRLVLVGLVLGRAARHGGVLAGATVTPLAHRIRAASLIAPIGIVARRRSRTGRRVLAQPIGQRPRQFAEPPRQIFKLLPRQTRKVCSFELGELRDA